MALFVTRECAVKFNDYFEFPRDIDMEPFTEVGLARLQGVLVYYVNKCFLSEVQTNISFDPMSKGQRLEMNSFHGVTRLRSVPSRSFSFVPLFVRSFLRACVRACVGSFVRSCVRACVGSFVRSFMFVCAFNVLIPVLLHLALYPTSSQEMLAVFNTYKCTLLCKVSSQRIHWKLDLKKMALGQIVRSSA